ncbi:MAG TPA: DUF3857 domain-containing protein, partial [Cyclobacteriaceae bacterium]|nr:DUF3857 domain-containing protein [Cyclobacteriaceae bacterium]
MRDYPELNLSFPSFRTSVLLAFYLCQSLGSFCQKPPAKFGEIPKEDMVLTVYAPDSSAAAVILFEYGVSYISTTTNDAKLLVENHVRIKILKSEGLEKANVQIPYYFSQSREDNITNLKASTYNLEDGKIVETKLGKEGTFKEKFNRNFNILKFTFPNVKVGSVLEYSYKKTSDQIAQFPNWRFQGDIPRRLSEYWAMIPDFFFFEKYMQGYIPLTAGTIESASYYGQSVKANHYVSEHVPAFKPEPYMTSEDDYVSKINFALSHYQFPEQPMHEVMGSWQKLSELLLSYESFGKVITASGFLKDDVAQITAGMTEPLQKIAAISNYVRQNFEWDGTKDYTADQLKKVFEKRKGTSGDLNLLLGSLLDKAGFDVEMVLLSTRDHGFIREAYPMERQFNYTICSVKAGDKTLLLDATEKYLPYDVLPSRCLNGRGLRISKTNFGWIDITSKAKEKTYINADLVLTDAGKLEGKITYALDGYDAQVM